MTIRKNKSNLQKKKYGGTVFIDNAVPVGQTKHPAQLTLYVIRLYCATTNLNQPNLYIVGHILQNCPARYVCACAILSLRLTGSNLVNTCRLSLEVFNGYCRIQ
jgi:hypothetical protein